MVGGQGAEGRQGADAADVFFVVVAEGVFGDLEDAIMGAVEAEHRGSGKMSVGQGVEEDGVEQGFEKTGPPPVECSEASAAFDHAGEEEIGVAVKGLGDAGGPVFGATQLAVIIEKGPDDRPGAEPHDGVDEDDLVENAWGSGGAGEQWDGGVADADAEKRQSLSLGDGGGALKSGPGVPEGGFQGELAGRVAVPGVVEGHEIVAAPDQSSKMADLLGVMPANERGDEEKGPGVGGADVDPVDGGVFLFRRPIFGLNQWTEWTMWTGWTEWTDGRREAR